MTFPTNVIALASAIGSQFLATAWGGTVGMAAGLNQILADLIAVETKLGTGASTAAANTVLRGTGSGTTAFGKVAGSDIVTDPVLPGTVTASAAVKAGTRIYPGALAGTTGVQINASIQMPYLNGALTANTAATIASFPIGRFLIFDLTGAVDGNFSSNSVSTLTDRGSDATIQIGGADPGASTSKIWVSLSSGTLQIYNRYAAAHFIILVGWGMN